MIVFNLIGGNLGGRRVQNWIYRRRFIEVIYYGWRVSWGWGGGGGSQKIPTRPRFATFVIRCFTGTGLGEFAVNWVDVITQIAVKPYSPVYEIHNREWYSPLNATCHGLFTSSFSLNCTETSVYTTEYKIVLDIARFEEKEDEAKHVSRPCVPSDCQEIW